MTRGNIFQCPDCPSSNTPCQLQHQLSSQVWHHHHSSACAESWWIVVISSWRKAQRPAHCLTTCDSSQACMCSHHDSAGVACRAHPNTDCEAEGTQEQPQTEYNGGSANILQRQGSGQQQCYEHKSKLNMRNCQSLQCYFSANACHLQQT